MTAVTFNFDEPSLHALHAMSRPGAPEPLAETVTDSLLILRTLQGLVAQGFTDLIVRLPRTGQERQIIAPGLTRIAQRRGPPHDY
ncbi:arabinose efflux permease family protein [Deinococcus grandis]|uniref:Arabinose efflux permease family protein n=1 Tax=Deinococcus grandis TaxID=57498 RepID=A0A100HQM8_9DEIO|nr:hypothetical protein [Deinococcus grandis]GAQ23884.1 arabinose efflux permease family protein [Deinococcus grandis]